LKEKTSEQLKIALEKKNIIEIDIQPRKLIIPLSKYDFKSSKLLVLQLGNISMNNFKGDENYDEKYKLDFASTGISFYNSLDELYGNQAGIALVKNMKLKLLIGLLTNRSMNKVLPKLSINLDIENIEINVTETMYYTFHFIVDIMKPTKQTDYWNILEQSKQDIKKNTKVCNRLLKKNNRYLYYDDYFAVLSGGYIYFYKNVDDDEYMEYFYIKDSVVTDKSIENIHEMHISNKYGNIDLQFTNEGKMKQWIKAITERVNEMKINWEEKDLITASTQAVAQLDKNEKDEPIDNIYDIIDVGVEINVRNICANLLDESKEMQKLFTINLTDFYFLLFIREKDVTMHMSLHSLRIYDEKYKHDPSFYEMLNSVNDSEYKLFSINILIAEVDSPRFNKAGIDIELKIGYLYAVWQPNSIRRLLHYLAHNDILRDKIKDEALGKTAEEIEKEMKTYPAEDEINKIKCNVTKELYMELSLTLQKVNIIWVNPINNIYFMNVSLNESNLYVEMTLDHFNVSGTLGNTQLADLTNYPYTIKSQQEYLDTKSFTEILGFKDSSSLTFEYHSYAIFCPLCKNNYTSKAIVNFNSVRLNYIQEYFFRMFNYLFAEFLGALSADQSVKDYKKERNQIPQIKSDEMEFLDLTCTFNNPQVLLKARNCFEEGFLADLGTVIITNSYTKKSGKIRNNPEIEKFISIYHFDLKELYIITHDKFKIVENTNAKVEMLFTALSEEENNMSDSLVDKSFVMNLWIDKIATNLRQNDFTYIMKCNDLNFLYIDGLDQQYNFTKNIEVAPSDEILIKDYNYMRVFLEIPNISLRLYEGTIFTEMILSEKTLTFEKKLNGMKEIDIVIRRCNIFNYLGVTGKEIMLTYYEDTENQNQFDIRMIIDSDGEKNMMIKIYNVKLTLRLDILQLIKTFFTEGFPIYDEHSKDLPNLFDPNEDNYPGMRVNLVLKKPVVSVLTDIMQNYDQDVICLTSDISMLYKKEKIINAKKELISNFRILNKELENTRDRNLLEKDIANDFKDTYVMNISLYEICCFVCTLNDIITSNLNIISKRKITNTFVFSYENKTLIHYYHPDTFIQSFRSLMEIKKITMKLSYRDIVLVLKAIEYNNSLMGIEYEGRMNKLTPKKPPIKIENTVVQSNTRDAGTGLYTVLSNGIQIVIIINIDSH
jgi:vacuolar protein sorting-associated protein 13A/C